MKIHKIYIDREVAEFPETRTICHRLNRPVEYLDTPETLYRSIANAPDPESFGKHVLWLTRNKGAFLRDCPGTANYTCCNYRILHIGSYCSMDCAYCILQVYFHPPVLTFFVNHGEMHAALDQLFSSAVVSRVGTGEFTDSLIWENLYPISSQLIRRFAVQDHAVLELKTKTTAVAGLLELPHQRKTILSWSLNTPRIIASAERFTAPLDARIRAAAECQAHGYPLAFHFDPMVIYPGCEKEYVEVIDQLFERISPENIVWISIGSFRFIPALKTVIERRFSDSGIVYGEFIRGLDSKMRYFKPLRIKLYRALADRIRSRGPEITLYFCMEDDEVWKKSLGFTPADHGGLPRMLDRSAVRHCGLDENAQSG